MALNENPTLEEIVNEVERLNNLIVNRGGTQTITPKTSNQILTKGYYKGDITIKGDSNLVASNILSGKSIFGVTGNVVTGKRWASGKIDAFSFNSSSYSVTVTTSLSFTPSMVIVSFPEVCTTYSTSTKYKANIVGNFNMGSGNKVLIPTYIRLHAYFDSISSSSFKFTVSNNADYTVYFKGEITWYAYE